MGGRGRERKSRGSCCGSVADGSASAGDARGAESPCDSKARGCIRSEGKAGVGGGSLGFVPSTCRVGGAISPGGKTAHRLRGRAGVWF